MDLAELCDGGAQVCRLCGKLEQFCINVFSEEGTRRYLGFKIQSKINILIKPDDGLPQSVCLGCMGRVEFLCEFYSNCHDAQKNFEPTKEGSNAETEVPKDKPESDGESDKENFLPSDNGKRKGEKPIQSEQAKVARTDETEDNRISQEDDSPNDPSTEKAHSTSSDNFNDNVKHSSEEAICNDINGQCFEKENLVETMPFDANSQANKLLMLDNSIVEAAKNLVHLSNSGKNDKVYGKRGRRPKVVIESKTKKVTGKRINNTIDKYMTSQTECNAKNVNEENIDPNNVETNTNNEEENVIFEGTIIDSTGDTSIIIPIKTESFNEKLNLNNSEMADGSEIVQAQEIVWVSNSFQGDESERSNTIQSSTNENKSSNLSSDSVESMDSDAVQMSNGTKPNNSEEQLLLVEVQLSAKENRIPKTVASLKKARSLSSSSRRSEGKYAKISELMSEKEKNEIEMHYTTDMSRVDDAKVNDQIIIFNKCSYQCKLCQTTYPRLDKCQVHVWRHLDMKPFLCKLCKFSTLTVSNIRCHIRKSHLKIKPFHCHICQKRYNSATLLEEHLNTHTGERPHQCQFCDFASTSKQVLSHHLLIHKAKKDIECDICGKKFYAKSRMRAHRVIHDKKRANKCNLCSAYILHEQSLERHYETVHMKDYICKICNKVYKSKKALHNHESVHSEAKFKCSLCPNVYKSTHILKEHLLKHQGIRKYQCNKCDKNFAQQSHLAAHMAVHSNVTYNCPGCQKGFNRHDNMKVHTKRCEKFLANPDLQKLLTKRKISFSKNNTAKVGMQKGNDNISETQEVEDPETNDSFEETAADNSVTNDIEMMEKNVMVTENVLSANEF